MKNKDLNVDELLNESDKNTIDHEMYTTYKQFMINPNVSGTSAYQMKLVHEGLTIKYNNMMKKFGNFDINIAKNGETYYFHIIIPSETVDNLTYDVVAKFIPPLDDHPRSLEKYYVQFFCNSPSFMYTFAYAFEENYLFANEFEDKTEKEFLTKAPINKNPYLMLGYDKFIYMACLALSDNDLLNINELKKEPLISFKEILKIIPDFETKFKESKLKRQREKSNERKTLQKKLKSRNLGSRVTSSTGTKASIKSKHDTNADQKDVETKNKEKDNKPKQEKKGKSTSTKSRTSSGKI
ncbi:hypothetical protein V6O07_13590, partial [Arthrospira platensis SPKY2]